MKGKRAEGKTNKTHTMVYLYRLANTPSKWLSTRIARPQGTSHVRPTTGMKADRRFAVPRCWSGGDSNCRSSLRSIYSGKVVTREISTRPFQKIREAFLRRVSSTARLNRAIFQQSPTSKRPKRDRRFESPPLHQRGSANRRSVPGFEKVETILRWDFDRVIVSHGNLLEGDGRARVRALSPICGRRSLSSRKSEVQCKIRLRSRRQDAP
jgi:hypothetical protein